MVTTHPAHALGLGTVLGSLEVGKKADVMVIEGENAVTRYREVMGPTDSKKAPAGTIRNKYGTNIERNAVHGSDAPETARAELAFFFAGLDLA